jgi:O-antigen ligase
LLGGGAGSWPRAYAAQRHTLDGPANAHSLYLETFAELGLVGLALLVAAFAAAVRGPPAAVAVVVAYLAAAAIDWDWQLPAVTIPALVGAAAGHVRRPLRASFAFAPVALTIGVLAGLHGIGAAVVENGITTRSQARLAARLLPYDARPWAFLYAATGSTDALRRACRTDAGDLTLKRESSPSGGCSLDRK